MPDAATPASYPVARNEGRRTPDEVAARQVRAIEPSRDLGPRPREVLLRATTRRQGDLRREPVGRRGYYGKERGPSAASAGAGRGRQTRTAGTIDCIWYVRFVPQRNRSSKPAGVPITTRHSVAKSRRHIWHRLPDRPTGAVPIGTLTGVGQAVVAGS